MRPTPTPYAALTYTSKGGPLTLPEFEANFTGIQGAIAALRDASVLAGEDGVFTPTSKLPLPTISYRAVGSLAAPVASLAGTLTDAAAFPLPAEVRIPQGAITPGCRVSGRAVFGRTGPTASWAAVRFGASGGIGDSAVTAIEMMTTGCVVYFDLDIGPSYATTAACHRYLSSAGDSFILSEMAMAPPAGDWFVTFSATSNSADASSSTHLLGYDVVVYP